MGIELSGELPVQPDIAFVASMIGEPARARMLVALMGGKALTATELSLEAEITAQTASSHLRKLVDSGLLVERRQGRHKYFQIQGHDIAEIVERLLNVSVRTTTSQVKTGPDDVALRTARVCYDHLAGELGVQLYDTLIERGYLSETEAGNQVALTDQGAQFFMSVGADLNTRLKSTRPLCKSCLDWSERRSHLAGALGQWILDDLLQKQWAQRAPDSRALHFSADGLSQLSSRYGLMATRR